VLESLSRLHSLQELGQLANVLESLRKESNDHRATIGQKTKPLFEKLTDLLVTINLDNFPRHMRTETGLIDHAILEFNRTVNDKHVIMPNGRRVSQKVRDELRVKTPGLSETANTSKGPKSFADWERYKKGKIDVNSEFREHMMNEEVRIYTILEEQIRSTLEARDVSVPPI